MEEHSEPHFLTNWSPSAPSLECLVHKHLQCSHLHAHTHTHTHTHVHEHRKMTVLTYTYSALHTHTHTHTHRALLPRQWVFCWRGNKRISEGSSLSRITGGGGWGGAAVWWNKFPIPNTLDLQCVCAAWLNACIYEFISTQTPTCAWHAPACSLKQPSRLIIYHRVASTQPRILHETGTAWLMDAAWLWLVLDPRCQAQKQDPMHRTGGWGSAVRHPSYPLSSL